jgi:uncharacterized protein YndB with AHSA1/START domain
MRALEASSSLAMKITVETLVNASPATAWDRWITPAHITKWYAASADWHTPRAANDVKVGGSFDFRMEARNGSAGFDFQGTYTIVDPHTRLHCLLGDGRHLDIRFLPEAGKVRIVEEFDAESSNSAERQRAGWQAILNSFKEYVEGT